MKFVLLTIFAFGSMAFAGECPEFTGTYLCPDTNKTNIGPADVVVGEASGFPTFQFRGVPDGSPFVIADDVLHKVDYGLSKGEYQARCENGKLIIHSSLIASSGDQFEADDQINVERKALVRVRVPKIPIGAKPTVTVCKPYIPPVH